MTIRRRNLLDQILVSSDSCLAIVDNKRRVRFFSEGMVRWTGWQPSQIEGEYEHKYQSQPENGHTNPHQGSEHAKVIKNGILLGG